MSAAETWALIAFVVAFAGALCYALSPVHVLLSRIAPALVAAALGAFAVSWFIALP